MAKNTQVYFNYFNYLIEKIMKIMKIIKIRQISIIMIIFIILIIKIMGNLPWLRIHKFSLIILIYFNYLIPKIIKK